MCRCAKPANRPTTPTPHHINSYVRYLCICTNSFAPKACPQRAPEFVHGYVNSLPRDRRCVSNNTPRSYRTFLNCIAFWIRILQKCICILHLLNMQILQNAYAFCIRITLRIMRSASRSRRAWTLRHKSQQPHLAFAYTLRMHPVLW